MSKRVAYSVEETATLLGVSPGSVRQQINRNHIPTVRIGTRIFIPASFLASFTGVPVEPDDDDAA